MCPANHTDPGSCKSYKILQFFIVLFLVGSKVGQGGGGGGRGAACAGEIKPALIGDGGHLTSPKLASKNSKTGISNSKTGISNSKTGIWKSKTAAPAVPAPAQFVRRLQAGEILLNSDRASAQYQLNKLPQ